MLSAKDALEQLQEGNRRFRDGEQNREALSDQARRQATAKSQEPFAIILGCSDSRVPAELVFDQGVGDLFVIRVAGNVVAPSQIGSVEFAAAQFGTPLVVVLGHSHCGAVSATLNELQQPTDLRSRNLQSIVNRIRPAVQGLLETDLRHNPEALISEAVKANVRASVNQLCNGSEILEELIQANRLAVVGAEYSLATGEVVFFDQI
ncbi:MAG: carbonic anhydrase [Halomonadaceae bacterium]|nr:MAG: carbonic anhydrase [Halomonadaceae bacterium]